MKPYYQDEKVQIYHGDCMEILPQIGMLDAVITDPPYNCGKDYGTHNDLMSDEDYRLWAQARVISCSIVAKNQFWVAPYVQQKTLAERLSESISR